MSNRNYVVCQPGMARAMEAAFPGMEVMVDDTLTTPYEIRERELTFAEALEVEVERAERQDADPKNALTFIVPMVTCSDNLDADYYNPTYLAVRVKQGPSRYDVISTIRDTRPITTGTGDDMTIALSQTIGALKVALRKAGYEVLSISEADGLTLLEEV